LKRWLLFSLILAGCTPRFTRDPRTIDMAPTVFIKFHVDVAMKGDRSMWLEEAAWRLEQDTRGKLKVSYEYDLDFSGRIQRFSMKDWLLVDLPEESPITDHFDKKHGVKVLGECDSDNRIVYLLHERLDGSHDRFVHVAMHEILHAVGLPHVKDDVSAIMAAIVVSKLPLRMAPTDIDAFCATVGCPTKQLVHP
jgi:hypothetical protein